LESFIREHKERVKQPFSPAVIKKFALKVARGLCYLHNFNPPIIHRDIKSSNILVTKNADGAAKQIALCDFGVSKVLSSSLAKTVVGTPGFMAPEVLGNTNSNQKTYTEKADVWSYGVLLSEIITQELPKRMMQIQYRAFNENGQNKIILPPIPSSIDPKVKSIIEIMEKCITLEPHKRPSATDVVSSLTQIHYN